MKLREIIAYKFVLLTSCLIASQVNALSVSPAVMDYNLDPGEVQGGKIGIYNDTDKAFTYVVSTQRFKAGGEDGIPNIIDEKEDDTVNDLKDWIKYDSEQKISLQPKEYKEFNFRVEVPKNAEPGGHYAVIFFAASGEVEGGSGVGLGAKLGVLVLVNVSGQITEGANIESFSIKNAFISHLPAEMSIRIKNTGTNYFRPKGNVTIKNIFGQESAKIPSNPNNSAVLPNSIRRIDTWWIKDQYSVKDEGFISGLKNEWKNFGFGYYKATAFVTYGTKNTELAPMSVSFWVFPWRITLIVLLIIIILVVGIKMYNKFIISSAMKKK